MREALNLESTDGRKALKNHSTIAVNARVLSQGNASEVSLKRQVSGGTTENILRRKPSCALRFPQLLRAFLDQSRFPR